MANLNDLADRLEKKAADVPQGATRLSVNVAKAIIDDLLLNTPVDTSKLISNWIVSKVKVIANIDAHFEGNKGSTAASSIAVTRETAYAALRAMKPGDNIVIGNATPYIRYVNDGTSKMAPRGFIERAQVVGAKAAASGKLSGATNV